MKTTLAILLALALAGMVAWRATHRPADKSRAAPGGFNAAVPVTLATAERTTVPVEIQTFGTVEARATVGVKSQASGLITNALFKEGQEVKAGDLLFAIDSRVAQADLKKAEANLLKTTSQLRSAEKEAQRQATLLQKGYAAEDARDVAGVIAESLAATMLADEAAVETARLQLEYCLIRAPISGRTGNLLVHAGNVVKADDIDLVTINQIRPILVRFALPQQELAAIQAQMAQRALAVRALIPGEETRPETGELVFVNNAVDASTGTIQFKARFDNQEERLWPGQFVNVALTVKVEPDAIVVPYQALQTGQKGTYVFVVQPDMTVTDRVVSVERTFQGNAVIAQGLKPGEQVVTDGHLRLAPGARVAVPGAPVVGKSARP